MIRTTKVYIDFECINGKFTKALGFNDNMPFMHYLYWTNNFNAPYADTQWISSEKEYLNENELINTLKQRLMKDIQKIEEYTDSKVIFICHDSNIEEEIINDKMKLDNDVIRSSKTEGYDLDKLYKSKLYWKGNKHYFKATKEILSRQKHIKHIDDILSDNGWLTSHLGTLIVANDKYIELPKNMQASFSEQDYYIFVDELKEYSNDDAKKLCELDNYLW